MSANSARGTATYASDPCSWSFFTYPMAARGYTQPFPPVTGTSVMGRIPAVRVVDVRFSAVSERHRSQTVAAPILWPNHVAVRDGMDAAVAPALWARGPCSVIQPCTFSRTSNLRMWALGPSATNVGSVPERAARDCQIRGCDFWLTTPWRRCTLSRHQASLREVGQ
jgi:hypothetical protein